MKLFFCSTYYHTLITFIKSITEHERVDLVLWNDMPGFDKLYERLLQSGQFNNIYLYDATRWKNEVNLNTRFGKRLFDRSVIKRLIPKLLGFPVSSMREYAGIYFYNDMVPPARYCIYSQIPYHLIEDALDYFSYFDQYWNIKESSFSRNGWRKRVKSIMGIGYTAGGQNDSCMDIEVNDSASIKIPRDKIIVYPRKELFGLLSEQERKRVYAVYAGDAKVKMAKKKSVIIFTQPLFKDNFVSSMEEQTLIFESIISEYCRNGFQVTLKPHPRDLLDYTQLIERYGCEYIDKNIPSEILNFDNDAVFDEAVSITSTAINFLENVMVKRFLGRGYIDSCLRTFSSK
ncbi:MAG: alpha-2,8-polysialyltransferase family protein [Firmicutes bacterium]|nr:alpha-2,8-polysialyltransferase family protein [Bacillota bacterium]